MPAQHDPAIEANENEAVDAAPMPSARWLDIARAGLSQESNPENRFWDELDLDNPDERVFGDYELLERIGRGGMGVVFRARQRSLDREVAIKFIAGSVPGNAPAVARFLSEARAAARLHHPHIVPVFEVGSIDGLHFFSMPLLRGQTLAQRLGESRIAPTQAVLLLLKLGAAVDYAHSLGLLHLDLKPANILFDEHDQPLIGDFGLARHMDADGGVDAQEVSGTPGYMAPEQIDVAHHRLSARSDVYSLGAILYEVLTGVLPQAQDDTTATMRAAATNAVVAPCTIDRSVDRDLEAICMMCLRVDPRERYQSVAELNSDLARYRDGDSVNARHLPLRERVWRSLRRHPALTLAMVAAFAAMALGLAATSWQWRRAEQARADADRQAMRTQQLAGLMAAAFPAGSTTPATNSTSAKNAVAWLKQHAAADPAAQRAVLTAFRQALVTADKGDVVTTLMNEIIDQLGEDYRRQQVERLAALGDRDSLIAAALIGIPRSIDTADDMVHSAVLQRLFDEYPKDPLALYAVALACHIQPQPCAHPDYYARLVAEFPDNAVHWVLVPKGGPQTDRELTQRIVHAAAAKEFDDRLAALETLLRAALHTQQVPDSIRQPLQSVVEDHEVAPSLRRNTVDSVALPHYGDIVQACKPGSAALAQTPDLRDACSVFAEKGMRSRDASILASMVSSAILRRLHKGTPLEAEAKEYRRQYVWLSEHADSSADAAERMQQDIAQFGEWEAYQRQAERAGVARTPPAGWVPKHPEQLLLSEERAKPAQ